MVPWAVLDWDWELNLTLTLDHNLASIAARISRAVGCEALQWVQKWHCQNWITIGYHETVQTRWLLAEQGKVSGTTYNGGDGRLFIDRPI